MATAAAGSYDVVVVGGSYAGLQAALTLGRARRSVLVVDDGRPRNRPAAHVHNFLGQAGPAPHELRAAAIAGLAGYAVEMCGDRAVKIEPSHDGSPAYVLAESGARFAARAVLLATGLRDETPDVPGVAELWGRDVVACPHCHGWEVRDRPLAQLGMRGLPAKAVERAALLSRWSRDVVLFTDGDELTGDQLARLKAAGVAVKAAPVRRLVHEDGRLRHVELEDGTRVARRAVFVVTRQHQQSDLARETGCRIGEDGLAVAVDAQGRTSVPGVWAAGTTAAPALLAIGAAGHASSVAVALHNDLLERDLVEAGFTRDRAPAAL